ncbi:MAG: hypothetical protein PVJ92_03075 [Candidatus Dependentiae bacterium]|jgi:hypothetical protein
MVHSPRRFVALLLFFSSAVTSLSAMEPAKAAAPLTSAAFKRKVVRKPPHQTTKVNQASLISEVAVLYGLLPLPYDWQALSSSYASTGKYDVHELIQSIANQAAAREETNPDTIKRQSDYYIKLLTGHLAQFRGRVAASGGDPWIKVVCNNLIKQDEANLTDQRGSFAPSAKSNAQFDPHRYIAYLALMDRDFYRAAHNIMNTYAEAETPIVWRHKGVTMQGTRLPLMNRNRSCVPYSLIVGAHQCQPAAIKDLDQTVAGLRKTIAEYIRNNMWQQFISSFFNSPGELLDHCEHLKSHSDYGAHGSAFQAVDIQAAALLLQANIYIVRAVPPYNNVELKETTEKGILKAVPHAEFTHPDQSQVKRHIHLLFTHHEKGSFYKPIMSHCEPIIGVNVIDGPDSIV